MSEYVSDTYTHLLQPDTLLPLQYFAALRRKATQEPERRLVIAVLEDAVDCYQKYFGASDRRGQQLFVDAEDWFLDTDRSWPFAFENICDFIGVNSEYLRRGLQAWKERMLVERSQGKVVPLKRPVAAVELADQPVRQLANDR
ncbi:MAG TPA: hypothetical protein VEB21_15525 [Terriglobales bacterium]|nr:hypothetical protein [Terriglobales bacterium]